MSEFYYSRADFISPFYKIYEIGLMKRFENLGIPIQLWTVNDLVFLKDLINSDIHSSKDNSNVKDDWSEDLTNLDLELKRIGWAKEEESILLMQLFGYNNRIKLTSHRDLILLINILKEIQPATNINHVEAHYNLDKLIAENNLILSSLGWDHEKARNYLQEYMGVLSRKELTIKNMIYFNNQLKELKD